MRRCSTRRLDSMDLFTATAVELLGSRGYRARRLVEGSPEWRMADLPVAIGAE